jgi:hypothetical protein
MHRGGQEFLRYLLKTCGGKGIFCRGERFFCVGRRDVARYVSTDCGGGGFFCRGERNFRSTE